MWKTPVDFPVQDRRVVPNLHFGAFWYRPRRRHGAGGGRRRLGRRVRSRPGDEDDQRGRGELGVGPVGGWDGCWAWERIQGCLGFFAG